MKIVTILDSHSQFTGSGSKKVMFFFEEIKSSKLASMLDIGGKIHFVMAECIT
jgi:hypothetical protein